MHRVVQNGDTYSSMEVIGLIGRAKAEIERLRTIVAADGIEKDRLMAIASEGIHIERKLVIEIERLREALRRFAIGVDQIDPSNKKHNTFKS